MLIDKCFLIKKKYCKILKNNLNVNLRSRIWLTIIFVDGEGHVRGRMIQNYNKRYVTFCVLIFRLPEMARMYMYCSRQNLLESLEPITGVWWRSPLVLSKCSSEAESKYVSVFFSTFILIFWGAKTEFQLYHLKKKEVFQEVFKTKWLITKTFILLSLILALFLIVWFWPNSLLTRSRFFGLENKYEAIFLVFSKF